MMLRSKKALSNLLSGVLLQIITVICGFIVPKLIIESYGSSVNGLISSITQFLAYITLLESGFGPVVKSILYKPIAKKDTTTITRILKSTEKVFHNLAKIFIVYIILLCLVYPHFMNDFDIPFTISLILILSISTLTEYLFGITYSIYLQAEQKTYIISRIQTVTTILNAIMTIILIKLGCSIQIVKLASAFIFILKPIILNAYIKNKYNINLSNVKPNYKIKQRWDGLAQHIAYVIHSNTDVVILSLFANIKEVSVYAVYSLVLTGLKNFIFSLKDSFSASFGDMLAKNEHENLSQKFKAYELFYHTIITIIYICTLILIVPFVTVYTKDITDENYIRPLFATIIVIAEFIYAFRVPYATLTQVAGHFKQTQRSAWIETALNIIISVILVLHFGIIGVAIGTLASVAYRTIDYVIYASRHQLKRSYAKPLFHIIIIIFEALLALFLANFIPLPNFDSYLSWAYYALIVLPVVAAIVITINFTIFHKDAKILCQTLKRAIKRKEPK